MAITAPSTSYLATAGKIALATTSVLAVATIGYAAVFDYRRRNDPTFRKSLLKQKKKVQKVEKKKGEVGAEQVKGALRRAIQLVNQEKVPESPEGKEQFFMEQVALGEQLAARSPDFYVASAISFYKALKVYPAPQELLMIYQKTQPAAVFDLVMELISLEINDAAEEAQKRGNLRDANPLLEEIVAGEAGEKKAQEDEDEEAEEIVVGGGAASKPASSSTASSTDGVSPSSGSSFVHVEGDAVVSDEGEVVAAEGEVVSAPVEALEKAVEAAEEKGEIDPPEPTLSA
ncbi:hypothetical protein JCM11641_004875 [Rhodosporidiobolus odoratus]